MSILIYNYNFKYLWEDKIGFLSIAETSANGVTMTLWRYFWRKHYPNPCLPSSAFTRERGN